VGAQRLAVTAGNLVHDMAQKVVGHLDFNRHFCAYSGFFFWK
jgi:hypothetical protein